MREGEREGMGCEGEMREEERDKEGVEERVEGI
jgi:hypothetical protein